MPRGSLPQLSLEFRSEVVMDVDISNGHGADRRSGGVQLKTSDVCLSVELKALRDYVAAYCVPYVVHF